MCCSTIIRSHFSCELVAFMQLIIEISLINRWTFYFFSPPQFFLIIFLNYIRSFSYATDFKVIRLVSEIFRFLINRFHGLSTCLILLKLFWHTNCWKKYFFKNKRRRIIWPNLMDTWIQNSVSLRLGQNRSSQIHMLANGECFLCRMLWGIERYLSFYGIPQCLLKTFSLTWTSEGKTSKKW